MNFLEELAAEWYEYNGYFSQANIRFGPTGHGGHIGEMDVIAYHPKTKELVHIECSTDSLSWQKKKEIFAKKFKNAQKFYNEKFPFNKKKIHRIAITGFSRPRNNAEQKMNFGKEIEVFLVPEFIVLIATKLSKLDPWYVGINEASYPLLRAIQFGTFYLKRTEKRSKNPKN